HARKEIRRRIAGPLAGAPKANKRFLHDIFRVGMAGDPLPGEQHERRSMPVQPDRPVISFAGHAAPGSCTAMKTTPTGYSVCPNSELRSSGLRFALRSAKPPRRG